MLKLKKNAFEYSNVDHEETKIKQEFLDTNNTFPTMNMLFSAQFFQLLTGTQYANYHFGQSYKERIFEIRKTWIL